MRIEVKKVEVGQVRDKEALDLAIAAFGYESRASVFCSKLRAIRPKADFILVDYQDLRNGPGFEKNQAFLRAFGHPVVAVASIDYEIFVRNVSERIAEQRAKRPGRLTLHLDYSCMPRNWYCRLAVWLIDQLGANESLQLWYTPGEYSPKAFSPSGIDDFDVFSGQASVRAIRRTHIVGLGFEGTRTGAILSVVDPEYLICFYADPGVNPGYVDRVKAENSEILLSCQHQLKLSLEDFGQSFYRLRAVVQEFHEAGDVILIPDGPKPLVLAASLIPTTLEMPGVTCLHVRRKSREPEAALEVSGIGDPIGAELTVTA